MKTRKRGIKCYLLGESKKEILKTVRRGRVQTRTCAESVMLAGKHDSHCHSTYQLLYVLLHFVIERWLKKGKVRLFRGVYL